MSHLPQPIDRIMNWSPNQPPINFAPVGPRHESPATQASNARMAADGTGPQEVPASLQPAALMALSTPQARAQPVPSHFETPIRTPLQQIQQPVFRSVEQDTPIPPHFGSRATPIDLERPIPLSQRPIPPATRIKLSKREQIDLVNLCIEEKENYKKGGASKEEFYDDINRKFTKQLGHGRTYKSSYNRMEDLVKEQYQRREAVKSGEEPEINALTAALDVWINLVIEPLNQARASTISAAGDKNTENELANLDKENSRKRQCDKISREDYLKSITVQPLSSPSQAHFPPAQMPTRPPPQAPKRRATQATQVREPSTADILRDHIAQLNGIAGPSTNPSPANFPQNSATSEPTEAQRKILRKVSALEEAYEEFRDEIRTQMTEIKGLLLTIQENLEH